jgi:bacterioferritin
MSKADKKDARKQDRQVATPGSNAKATKPMIPTSGPTAQSSVTPAGITDVKTLRERARRSIDDGAVTESYTADRKQVIRLLNEALATEWVCVLRYYRHFFMASGMLADSVKAEFLEHAHQEQEHANRIAERIVQLGGEPDLNPETLTARSHAEYKPGHDLRDMVKEDLIAERIAIDSYREMIQYIGDRDTTTKRILEHVLAQEEEHANDMADLLDGWVG